MPDLTTLAGLLTFAATAGVISALVNQGIESIRLWRASSTKRKSEAGYLAIQLAALLEGYAYACAKLISKNASAQPPPDEQYPDWDWQLPELPTLPDEKDGWRSLNLKLVARVLELRNRIAGSQGLIASTAEYVTEDLGDEIAEQAAARGKEAWELATDLRRHCDLSDFEPVWTFKEFLDSALQEAREAKEDRARQQARLLVDFATDDKHDEQQVEAALKEIS